MRTVIIRRVSLWLFLVAGFGACAQPDHPPRPEVTRTDSAGVEIVVSAGPAWTTDEVWRLADEPSLELPSIDARGNRHFYRVSAAHRYPDGRLVVSDWRAKRLRFYGPDGAFLRAGAKPAGPGKFATIIGFVVGPGDSLAVYDLHSNVTILAPDGEYVRRVPLPEETVLRSELRSWSPDGQFCAVGFEHVSGFEGTEVRSFPPADSWDNTIPFCFQEESPVTATDSMPSAFGSFPGQVLQYYEFGDKGHWSGLWTPFETRPSAVVRGDDFLLTPGEAAEIQVRRIGASTPGRLHRVYRFRRPRVPVTEELRDHLIRKDERMDLTHSANEDWNRGYLTALREAELPDSVSAIADMLVDEPGNLWLGHPWPDDGAWTVLSPDGVWLGSVEIPDGMKPLEIGDDWMLVRTQEVNEVHSVRLYELVKP